MINDGQRKARSTYQKHHAKGEEASGSLGLCPDDVHSRSSVVPVVLPARLHLRFEYLAMFGFRPNKQADGEEAPLTGAFSHVPAVSC